MPPSTTLEERLWLRVNRPDVPLEIAPMLRDALRNAGLGKELEWRTIERRATFRALLPWLVHTVTCPTFMNDEARCTCGLSEAMAEARR